jgi:hypothetical protein
MFSQLPFFSQRYFMLAAEIRPIPYMPNPPFQPTSGDVLCVHSGSFRAGG